ncbi:hypothetical protein HOP50_04g30670 [Chloropicon primus]|uniref:Uncharacterized protein n=1 Tax=Chloropicon primus TaxID=1764295 RepID=A0A5B8MJ77_9CHLO|nr:hypothetical protein A3770_04p30640 [Chloropicon primus]UPQ99758.1 hypothetical protein HOP50_04g30670 [Chloropicon primus]|eukprot:QDZ20546.1 hypothetical protein A3770_04p30640 [Chloropicon primus]
MRTLLAGFVRHLVPKELYAYGPVYHSKKLLDDEENESASGVPVPVTDEKQTIVPVSGFESAEDRRNPVSVPCFCELPGLHGKMEEEEWKECRAFLNEGLKNHINLPFLHNFVPAVVSLLGLTTIVLLIYQTVDKAQGSGSAKGTMEIGIIVAVMIFLFGCSLLYVLVDHFKNVEMERRCSELTRRFRAKKFSFAFLATRHSRLMKALKFLVVFHEGNEGILEAEKMAKNPAAMQLCSIQRRYTRNSVDQGQVTRPAPKKSIQEYEEGIPNPLTLSPRGVIQQNNESPQRKKSVHFNPIVETACEMAGAPLPETLSRLKPPSPM